MPVKRKATSYVKRKAPAYKPKPKGPSKSYLKKDDAPSNFLATGLGTLAGMGGAYLAGPSGALAGFTAGNLAGDLIHNITGFGDYKISQNSLVMGQPPNVRNTHHMAGGSVRISHKEYIGDIFSSSSANSFKVEEFPINPGVDQTFPWLAQMASSFQEYSMRGLVFHFRSMSGNALNSTNTALGSVIMSTQYNSAEPSFSSKSEMENNQFSNSIRPSESCLHMVECARATSVLSNLYVRSDAVDSASQDIRFTDLGRFSIASTGCQGTSVNLGELWVSYELDLIRPKLYAELGETIGYFNAYSLTGITNALPLGTGDYENNVNNNTAIVLASSVSAQTITFPQSSAPKTYFVRIFWRGNRTASLDAPDPTYSNCNADGNVFAYTSAAGLIQELQAPDNNASSDSAYLDWCTVIQTDGNNRIPKLSMGAGGTLPASAVICNIIIFQIPNTYAWD